MKVAHIVPTAVLGYTRYNDYHLVLPHLMEDPEYAKFYKEEATGHKILDNGIAEAVDVDDAQLLRVAHYIQADEVVAPDVMGDCDRTIAAVNKFRPLARANRDWDYIGVIQGKSYAEIVRCLAFYQTQQDWIRVIALPRILANTVHKDIRSNFALAFEQEIQRDFKAIHCLGASAKVDEVKTLAETGLIRGIDTSMPAVMGLEGRLIDKDPYVPRGEGFFEAKPKSKQYMAIEHNISVYTEWARGV